MNRLAELLKSIYIKTTGYSYTNLGRLFLRLFIGLMLLQFGVREWMNFDAAVDTYTSLPGMESSTSLILLIIIEIGCSLFIMAGFLTRLMTLPPFILMILSEAEILNQHLPSAMFVNSCTHQGYLPVMFIGVYFFLLLVGPGKISVDYFLSLHFIHTADKSESELEEV